MFNQTLFKFTLSFTAVIFLGMAVLYIASHFEEGAETAEIMEATAAR